jgi:hypothetical protein
MKTNDCSRLKSGFHILGLFSFALAQPLFDLMRRYPEYLIAHRTTWLDLAVLILILTLVIPGLVVGVKWLLGLVTERWARWAHLACVCLLVAAIFNPPLKKLPDSLDGLRALAAFLLGFVAAWSYARWRLVRSFTTLLSTGVVIFPLIFLLHSSVLEVVTTPRLGFSADQGKSRGTNASSRIPLVMIIFDELPVVSLLDENRRIDARRYPSFAALAAESTWYRNATPVANNSTFSIPSILTGDYPDPEKIPIIQHYSDNLFTLLGASHRLRVVEAVSSMCPPELRAPELAEASAWERQAILLADTALVYMHVVMPDKIVNRLPEVRNTWKGFVDPNELPLHQWANAPFADRVGEWERFLSQLAKDSKATRYKRPSLYFIHLLLPHSPFKYLPSGREYSDDTLQPQRWPDEEVASFFQYRHLLQLGFVDRLLGDLISVMKRSGLYDSAVLVVLADHGMSFSVGSHGRDYTPDARPDVLSVPFFLKCPHQRRGKISDQEVELIDVLPTIADVLGVSPQWRMDGHSTLRPPAEAPKEKRVLDGGRKTWRHFPIDNEGKYRTLGRKLEYFGTGAGPDGFFRPRKRTRELNRFLAQIQHAARAESTSR